MNYCKHCGAVLEEQDTFCARCGIRINDNANEAGGEIFYVHPDEIPRQKEPPQKLFCELAYSGILFWLPLMTCPQNEYAKHSANQGLWVLIVSAVACTAIQILGVVKGFLAGWGLGLLFNGIYALLFMMFLFFMFFIAYKCYRCAMAVHYDREPESILFFGQYPIIK